MFRKCLIFATIVLWTHSVSAAYIGSTPVPVGVFNPSGQALGVAEVGQMTVPVQTATIPPLVAFPTPPPLLGKNAILPDVFGREVVEVTDGRLVASIAPPFSGAGAAQPALAVALSPNPRLTCPFIQNINQTANTTVITNPGGKLIHVCNLVIVNGTTQQGVTVAEGTGTACGTGTIYWDGGSGGTVQTAISGGWGLPGQDVNYPMQKAGDNVCVIQSGSTNISGHFTFGIYSP